MYSCVTLSLWLQLVYYELLFSHVCFWSILGIDMAGRIYIGMVVLDWNVCDCGTRIPELPGILTMFLLYKSESDSRIAVALQHTIDQERKIHHTAELNAARTEGRLMFELQSGFSQLHHVLKNLLVGMQVTHPHLTSSSC